MSLALYRSYRPGRLDDVVGQEHVTGPLRRALTNDRVHHAYLFAGPRGCGKTSTARILARSLNCEQGPTADPCGQCQSCQDLAPNGPGSIDVIELDAASHGGVDDTRDLRERAMFAPASSRFKIYIIDEAHMVTPAGFNALLKLVEEPPPHVRFVFATTEPEKVLPTIRSRTHNYTFRLVPARTLQQHLARICEAEGIPAEPAALALVARAGAGSVRDALSVLGQLIAGSGPEGLTYDDTVEQLGVTDAALLDATVQALADEDGAALFDVVDRVVEAGHDPRRFVTDLLERLRDLLVLVAVPGAAESGLLDVPDDRLATMAAQADQLGLAELSRDADVVSHGLSELRGATAPRLQLELMCARLLLPAADDHARGTAARLDRLERRIAALTQVGGSGPSPAGATTAGHAGAAHTAAGQTPAGYDETAGDAAARSAPAPEAARAQAPGEATATVAPAVPSPASPVPTGERRAGGPPPPPRLSAIAPSSGSGGSGSGGSGDDASATVDGHKPSGSELTPQPADAEPAATGSAGPAGSAGPRSAGGSRQLGEVRALWPEVLESLKGMSRVAWMTLSQATPLSVDGGVVAVGVPSQGNLLGARKSGHDERLRQALLEVMREDLRIDLVLAPGATAPASTSASAPTSTSAPAPTPAPAPRSGPSPSSVPAPPAAAPQARAAAPGGSEARPGPADGEPTTGEPAATSAAPTPPASRGRVPAEPPTAPDEPSIDDPDADPDGLMGVELAMRELGATPIGEIESS